MPGSQPPLKVIQQGGGYSSIPVFVLEVSGATLEKISPIHTRMTVTGATGAPTGAEYIVSATNASLSAEKVLTAGSNIEITTDSTTLTIRAITNSSIAGASTAGNYLTFLADAGLSNEKVLTAGSSIGTHTDSTAFYINAITSNVSGFQSALTIPLSVDSGGTGVQTLAAFSLLTGSGAQDIHALSVMSHGALLVGSGENQHPIFLNTAGQGLQLITSAGTVYGLAWANTSISASSGGLAGTGGNYVTFLADATLSNEKTLTQGSSVIIRTDSTAVYIDALTSAIQNTGGVVLQGTANYLAYYPNSTTLVDDSPISINTGSGIASLNLPILTSDPGSPSAGDVWLLSSQGTLVLKARSDSTYFL